MHPLFLETLQPTEVEIPARRLDFKSLDFTPLTGLGKDESLIEIVPMVGQCPRHLIEGPSSVQGSYGGSSRSPMSFGKSRETRSGKIGGLFSRKLVTPSRLSSRAPI